MRHPGHLGHVQRQVAHPLQAFGRVDRRQHGTQIRRHGRLQGQQRIRLLLALGAGVVDLGVVADHLFGETEVDLQECPRGALHGVGDLDGHGGQVVGELFEFDMVSLTHGPTLRPTVTKHRIAG